MVNHGHDEPRHESQADQQTHADTSSLHVGVTCQFEITASPARRLASGTDEVPCCNSACGGARGATLTGCQTSIVASLQADGAIQEVRVRADKKLVKIYFGTELIKLHARKAPGGIRRGWR